MTQSKQSRGGSARALSLSPERRKEIAAEAARQRWDQQVAARVISDEVSDAEVAKAHADLPIARWRGVLNLVGVDVPCYVLENGQKLIGRTSATEVLTGIKGGGALEKYIAVKPLEPFIKKDEVLERLVPFRILEVEGLEKAVKGLPADLMIDLCQGFVAALQASFLPSSTTKLTERQVQMAIQASMFLSACAKVG